MKLSHDEAFQGKPIARKARSYRITGVVARIKSRRDRHATTVTLGMNRMRAL